MKSKIEYPYNEMLLALKDIDGFNDFINLIDAKWDCEGGSLNAEIKALYELKQNGYLTDITSSKSSMPEGLFSVNIKGVSYKGMLEVAFIKYLFDSNEEVKEFINKKLNVKKDMEFDKTFPEYSLRIVKKKTGIGVIGRNIDINKKLFRLYEFKRKQHKKRFADFPEYVKLYYFIIDCPPNKLSLIESKKLLKRIHTGEIVAICSTYYDVNQQCKQTRIVLTRGIEVDLKLDNKYFSF